LLTWKAGVSPQKAAENWYRKAKNQKREVDTLTATIERKEAEMEEWKAMALQVDEAKEVKALRKVVKAAGLEEKVQAQPEVRPYHVFVWMGFEIRVGKNARSNDELTLRHAWKDDLWLHARDVPGSHVVVKHQARRPFPQEVIEKAAALAAWYSKRKTESLCPVIVTPRKFVRKRKGDPAGAVVVEKEEVVLVKPGLPDFANGSR
jgi:predicted ribosome quality control (RQC) complex YloA/Tae2 family protein